MTGHPVNPDLVERLRHEAAVAIPCYNAGDKVDRVVVGALRHAGRVWVIDDGSTDGAPDRAETLGASVLRLPTNRGKGHALLAGMAKLLDDPAVTCVITLDADGQHDPNELPRLFQAFIDEDADFVVGARTFEGQQVPWRSWFGNTLTALVLRLLAGRRMPDTQSGYRVHGRRFAEHILAETAPGRYETEMEIVVRAVLGGYRVTSVPIRTIYEAGNPSSHFRKLRDSWLIYRRLFRAVRNARRG